MSMSLGRRGLALACINIERSKHLSRVMTFLRAHAPDVTCLQEVVADDVDLLGEQIGSPYRMFIPMCRFPEPSGARPIGIAILSRQAFASSEEIYYAGGGSGRDVLDRSSEEARFRTNRYSVGLVVVASHGLSFTIATTHSPGRTTLARWISSAAPATGFLTFSIAAHWSFVGISTRRAARKSSADWLRAGPTTFRPRTRRASILSSIAPAPSSSWWTGCFPHPTTM